MEYLIHIVCPYCYYSFYVADDCDYVICSCCGRDIDVWELTHGN